MRCDERMTVEAACEYKYVRDVIATTIAAGIAAVFHRSCS